MHADLETEKRCSLFLVELFFYLVASQYLQALQLRRCYFYGYNQCFFRSGTAGENFIVHFVGGVYLNFVPQHLGFNVKVEEKTKNFIGFMRFYRAA